MSDHFYTTHTWERDSAANTIYHTEGIACYVFPGNTPGTVPLIRMFNPGSGDHFYTTNQSEANNAQAQGAYHIETLETCWVYASEHPGTVPLFRLWNNKDDHFYTTSASERDQAVATMGYHSEGIACWVYGGATNGAAPFWRLFADPKHPMSKASSVTMKSINYDLVNAQVGQTAHSGFWSQEFTNNAPVQETSEVDGQEQETDTSSWSNTVTLKASASLSGGVTFLVADAKLTISLEVDTAVQWGGSNTIQKGWSWKSPLIVPPKSKATAVVVVLNALITAPYSGVATFTFDDKTSWDAMVFGTYTGTNGYQLQMEVTVVPLDGSSGAVTTTVPITGVKES